VAVAAIAVFAVCTIETEAAQVAPAQKPAAEAPGERPVVNAVAIGADGTLTVIASASRPLSLKTVLNDISTQHKMPIVVAETVENDRVSNDVRGVSLDEGLKRLLAAYDAFYLYSAEGRRPGAIRAIWVYGRGEASDIEPVPATTWASTRELDARLEDPDPGVRAETFDALIERHGKSSLGIVLRGLVDSDDAVRLGTLTSALDAGVDIPSTDLHSLVLSDSLQGIRLLALEAIETRPEAMSIAESVKDDQDEVIRTTARLLLERLENRSKKPPR
jgi:hypothetical protein